jgi:Protein of unknown function (DUF1566)
MQTQKFTHHYIFSAVLALCSTCAQAQTCVSGTQASNPSSVYAIDGINGTVTDTRTGLMWDRCVRGLSGVACETGAATTFTWQGALDAAAGAGRYKGYGDWRLPNVRELRSLVEECRARPAINEYAFPNAQPVQPLPYLWSSSPAADSTIHAWTIAVGSGGPFYAVRTYDYPIRLVRGGQ